MNRPTNLRPSEPTPLEFVGTATVEGRVTYRAKVSPTIARIKPTKDADKFPAEVPGAGWYVDEKTQGIRYVLVFLKPPSGFKMPVAAEAESLPVDKDGKPIETVQIGSPKGQFDPRIVLLHPSQKLEIINNSDPPVHCDAKLDGPGGSYHTTFKPGDKHIFDLEPTDREPYRLAGGLYHWKSGYVWRMTHPYAAVTDAEGRFELKHVPVPAGDRKLTLWVWHELLADKGLKEIGPLDLVADQVLVKSITLPD